jgi:hypothetical protein
MCSRDKVGYEVLTAMLQPVAEEPETVSLIPVEKNKRCLQAAHVT